MSSSSSPTFALDPGAAAALRELFAEPARLGAALGPTAIDRALDLARALARSPAAGLWLLGRAPAGGLALEVDPRLVDAPTERACEGGRARLAPLRAPLLPSGEGAARVFGVVAVGPTWTEPLDVAALARHVATTLVAGAVARAADRDPLTALLARPAFERALPAVTAALAGGAEAAALALDVDGLRSLNAARGHRSGDELLRTLGAALAAEVGAGGLACRHGGDELVALVPGLGQEGALAVAARLATAAGSSQGPGGAPMTITVGVAHARGGVSAEGLLARADQALARAKDVARGGRLAWQPTAASPPRREDLAGLLTGDLARDRRLVQALLDAVVAVSRLRPVGEVLEEIVDRCVDLAAADRGLVLLRGADGAWSVQAARARGGRAGEAGAYAASIVDAALAEGRAVHRVAGGDEEISPSAEVLGVKAVLCAPLQGPDVPTGAIYVDSASAPGGAFDPAIVAFFDALAAQATTALRNAALHERERARAVRLAGDVEGRDAELARVRKLWERDRRERDPGDAAYEGIIGRSPAMREVFAVLRSLEGTQVPVVIEGESGTGKELVARAIHARSPRRQGPLVTVNCAAIPEALVESELFGHVRGAFTGATSDRAGLLEAADGGTLFLDEVGELPLDAQAKLLRALQQGEVRPVGASDVRRVDARIVAATNRDLRRMIAEGTFREDLYYRLAVFRVELPPLRRRAEDIPLIVEHVLAALARRGVSTGGITGAAVAALGGRAWRGNVRELENVLERAAALAAGAAIDVAHIRSDDEDLPAGVDAPLFELPMKQAKALFSHAYARRAIERAGGSVPGAAATAKVTRQTLYRVLAEGDRVLEALQRGEALEGGDD
ncbi:MAG: sigma 54-interacting transcriptional regulator [Planctomycetes bacterium]|nr:sigma 54-interacting transcriptional regulator [Planctomycetota bacterium]